MPMHLKLRQFLPYKLSVLSSLISRDIAQKYQQRFDLSIPEWRLMAVLGEFSKLSPGQAAQLTTMDKVAVSRAVSKLVKTGRLRKIQDVRDKRCTLLTLSSRGYRVYKRVVPLALSYEAALLSKIDKKHRIFLDEVLVRLAKARQEVSL